MHQLRECCAWWLTPLGEGARGDLNTLIRALNYGDCFRYALAMATDDELLCIGDGFPRTDVRLAGIA